MSIQSRYLSARALELIAAIQNPLAGAAAGLEDVLPISQGDPDLPTPSHIVEAAKAALDEGYTHYTPVRGTIGLRQAIGKKLDRENSVAADPTSEIMVTSGGQEGIYALVQALLGPGDELLLSDPGYTAYNLAALAAGSRVVSVPTFQSDDFLMRPAEIARRISARTKALVVVNPNMPAAGVFARETLGEIAALAGQHDLIVISDEMYEKFVFDGAEHTSLASLPGMKERTITLGGVSKTYSMTGWRLGWVAGPSNIIHALEAMKHAISICAASVSQSAAKAALEGPQDCVDQARSTYGRRRRFLMDRLDGMGLSYGRWKGGFSVLVNIKETGLSAADFSLHLLRKGRVFASPGSAFGPAGEGHVRVSFLSPISRLEEAMNRFERVWDELK